MERIIQIYHGSTNIIESPEFGKGNPHNDYGLGFYCTESLELAKEWACINQSGGYANTYTIEMSDLSLLELTTPEYGILEWLAILVNNRVFNTSSQIASEAKEYLIEHFLPDVSTFDVIKGYRADDSYFTFATDFLSNAISLRQLNRAMLLGELGEQFMIKSKKAFNKLQFIGSEAVDGEVYFSKRSKRDSDAREQYLKRERKTDRRTDDIFMLSILNEEMKRHDSRL